MDDTLIFLGTLAAVLVGGFLVIKFLIHRRSSGRYAKRYSTPSDYRLKQQHTGRPHLRHQTFARKDSSDDIWKASRSKVYESSWERSTFTANKILSDSELALESKEPATGHGGSPSVNPSLTEPFQKPSKSAAGNRKNR